MKSLFFVAVVFLLLMSACDISKPKMPSWDVELNVPLTSQKLFVSDLADGENIIINEDELLTLTGEGDAQSANIGHVNYTPDVELSNIPLYSGLNNFLVTLPIQDPEGKVSLSSGHFVEGTLAISFTDIVPGTGVELKFPQVTTASNSMFTIIYDGSPGWQYPSLVGYTIEYTGDDPIISFLEILVTVTNPTPGIEVGHLGLVINSRLGFDEFRGRLVDYRRVFSGENAPLDIDYPLNLENVVQVEGAKLILNLSNEIGFEVEFHGDIYAKNTRTNQDGLLSIMDTQNGIPTPYLAEQATATGPGTITHTFEENFSQLLSIMPDYVELRNAYLLINSHGNEIGFVSETNTMSVHYVVEAPLRLTILDEIITMQDPVKVKIAAENRTRIRDNVLSANLGLQVLNRVPLGGEATIYVGTSEGITPTNPSTYSFTKSFTLLSSLAPGGDTEQPNSYNPNLQLSLSRDELDVFTNPEVYLLFSFHFAPSNGVVEISASPESYVEVHAMLNGTLRIEEDM